jgi:hypothetical protein
MATSPLSAPSSFSSPASSISARSTLMPLNPLVFQKSHCSLVLLTFRRVLHCPSENEYLQCGYAFRDSWFAGSHSSSNNANRRFVWYRRVNYLLALAH